MGTGGDPWAARIGLIFLGLATLTGVIGGSILATQNHDIPPFLSGICGSCASTLGVVILAIYGRGQGGNNNGGNGQSSNVKP